MIRRRSLLPFLVLAACSSGKSNRDSSGGQGGQGTKPVTTDGAPVTQSDTDPPDEAFENAKKVVPGALSMEEVELGASGLRGYWIGLSSGPPDRGIGVVTPDGVAFLKREEGMRKVLEGGRDALVLARAAMLLLEHGGKPLGGPGDLPAGGQDQAKKAGVAAPSISGDTLTYWSYYRKVGQPDLLRSQVDLAALTVKTSGPGADADPIDKAVENLASPNEVSRRSAVETLAGLCSDARAAKALIETLGSHTKVDTRRLAAQHLEKCPGKDTVAALGKALGGDADTEVRAWAAGSLGGLKDPAGKAALEKAAKNDADDGVRRVAEKSLKKIP